MLPAPAPVVVVQQDFGGRMSTFQQRVERYARRGTRVHIEGECDSACTLVLQLGDHVCVGPLARLGFHQSYIPGPIPGDASNRSEEGTALFWRSYPAPVRAWIDANGGLTADLIVLEGAELRSMLQECRS